MSVAPITRNSFDAVAEFYDQQPNPVIALEQRFLAAILPEVRGLDVVELGCGTGRWLQKLSSSDARSLTGVDPSAAMLAVAREKLSDQARLLEGSVEHVPLLDSSSDVILVPFVLSYCDSLEHVAQEVARIARPHATIFVSDLHPETELALSWRRSFRSADGAVEMESARHSIKALTDAFRRVGFELVAHLELPFEEQDAATFAANRKQTAFESARGLPAIYLAQFAAAAGRDSLSLTGARVALGGMSSVEATVTVSQRQVSSLGLKQRDAAQELDLQGCMILPALMNAHDHLEFALYPNLGGGLYQNSVEWAQDIHQQHREVIALQERVPKDVRLYFGALRNLLAGVTSVCHHNPDAQVFRNPDFPVRVVDGLSWAHSLAFEPEIREKFTSRAEQPFVVHAAEGVDERASSEITELERVGVLSERTVLVHGLACSEKDVELLNRRKASVVLCASSNHFLFGRTLRRKLFEKIERAAIGTDSPLTAQGDLLNELRFVQDQLGLSCESLFAKCTSEAAGVLQRTDGSGRLRVGGVADFVVVRDTGISPAERLLSLHGGDLELVIVKGQVHLASEGAYVRLPEELRSGLSPLRVDGVVCWVRAPLAWMFEQARSVLGSEITLGGKRVEHAG